MKAGIIITSHRMYRSSLVACLQSAESIDQRLVVAGGHDHRCEYRIRDVPVVGVTHDSYDYTGLIEAVESPSLLRDWTHVLCVQDTMELSRHTLELCCLADPEANATAANGGMCNLVLYRVSYLMAMRDFILQQKNCSKVDSIRNEGAIWRMDSDRREFSCAGVVVLGVGCPYSETPRIKEFYPSLSILKWKANYGQNMHALVECP